MTVTVLICVFVGACLGARAAYLDGVAEDRFFGYVALTTVGSGFGLFFGTFLVQPIIGVFP